MTDRVQQLRDIQENALELFTPFYISNADFISNFS